MIGRYSLPEMAGSGATKPGSRTGSRSSCSRPRHGRLSGRADRPRRAVRERAPLVDAAFVAEVAARELVTDHDVAAFVDVVQAAIGVPEGSWVHHG